MMEDGRICNKCKIYKEKESFSINKKKNRLQSYCKKCACEHVKAKYWENPEKFKAKAREYRRLDPEKHNKKYREWNKGQRVNHPNKIMLRRAKRRARELNLPFNLEPSDIIIPEICPVLGIAIKGNCPKNNLPSDNSASLDRIDNNKGYVRGNIVIISMKANRIKNNSSFEELEKIYLFYKTLKETT